MEYYCCNKRCKSIQLTFAHPFTRLNDRNKTAKTNINNSICPPLPLHKCLHNVGEKNKFLSVNRVFKDGGQSSFSVISKIFQPAI